MRCRWSYIEWKLFVYPIIPLDLLQMAQLRRSYGVQASLLSTKRVYDGRRSKEEKSANEYRVLFFLLFSGLFFNAEARLWVHLGCLPCLFGTKKNNVFKGRNEKDKGKWKQDKEKKREKKTAS